MSTAPLTLEKTIHAPKEKVWKALTDSIELAEWFFDAPAFQAKTGQSFSFELRKNRKAYVHFCKVTEVSEENRLSYTWRYKGYKGDSEVSFELFPEGDRTRIKVAHRGIETFPSDNADFSATSFEEGWNTLLDQALREFLEEDSIRLSIEIQAPVEKVWHTLTDDAAVRQWAEAFGEGVFIETDWNQGSEVVWKNEEGYVGARGVLTVKNQPEQIKITFYQNADEQSPAPLGTYSETYTLQALGEQTTLHIEAGTMAIKYCKMHRPLWTEAIETIKELAEEE